MIRVRGILELEKNTLYNFFAHYACVDDPEIFLFLYLEIQKDSFSLNKIVLHFLDIKKQKKVILDDDIFHRSRIYKIANENN